MVLVPRAAALVVAVAASIAQVAVRTVDSMAQAGTGAVVRPLHNCTAGDDSGRERRRLQ